MMRASVAPRPCFSTITASTGSRSKSPASSTLTGLRMHPNDGRVVSNFIVQALKGEALTIFGEGSQTRSFCYVDDLMAGIVGFMESPADLTGPFNLGNPVEFTIKELTLLVIELTGSKSKLNNLPLPPDDPRQRQPDISLAKKALGWEPIVPLRDGLRHTISYFDQLLAEGSNGRLQGL